MAPTIVTKIENFLQYVIACFILSAPSSFPIIIEDPIAIHTEVIIKKLPVVEAI